MKHRKMYVVRTSMIREEENRFDRWQTYGVFSSLKRATDAIEQNYQVNRGWEKTEQPKFVENVCLMQDYKCLSTDQHPCKIRDIVEVHTLNKAW